MPTWLGSPPPGRPPGKTEEPGGSGASTLVQTGGPVGALVVEPVGPGARKLKKASGPVGALCREGEQRPEAATVGSKQAAREHESRLREAAEGSGSECEGPWGIELEYENIWGGCAGAAFGGPHNSLSDSDSAPGGSGGPVAKKATVPAAGWAVREDGDEIAPTPIQR